MKEDLADFEKALQDGFITEDRLEVAKEDVAIIKNNYDRLSYIMYLLEMPNKPKKKAKYVKANKKIVHYLEEQNATAEQTKQENQSALDHLRTELKKLK
jgi:F0F1-type ATP synthase beta subunit